MCVAAAGIGLAILGDVSVAHASAITETVAFTASNFTGNIVAPFSTVSGRFTVTVDPLVASVGNLDDFTYTSTTTLEPDTMFTYDPSGSLTGIARLSKPAGHAARLDVSAERMSST